MEFLKHAVGGCVVAVGLVAGNPAHAQSIWSGPYVGLSVGYGSGHSSQTDLGIPTGPPPIPPGSSDGHYSLGGGLLGGTFGYNCQQSRWVFGVEGDYSWADINGSSSTCGTGGVTPHPCGTSLDSFGTLRGRVGYAIEPAGSILPYVTGGLSVGNVRGWDSLTPASGSSFRAGWNVGAGVEAMIAPRWTAKLEYLHTDLGRGHLFDVVPGVPETVSFRADVVRIGVNYLWGGPVVAKY
jgi:outer membrane immunogenic protein